MIPNRFSNGFILEALEFILRNNNFKFDEKYNQTEGTAMGTKCAPPYGCLVVGYKEETNCFQSSYPSSFQMLKLKLLKMFLNDIWMTDFYCGQ